MPYPNLRFKFKNSPGAKILALPAI